METSNPDRAEVWAYHLTLEPTKPFPHSGTCVRCLRERDDLFWHAQDRALYCTDVFRCEARYYVQGERETR